MSRPGPKSNKERILDYIVANPDPSAGNLQSALKIPGGAVRRILVELRDEGRIVRGESGPVRRWSAVPFDAPQTDTPDGNTSSGTTPTEITPVTPASSEITDPVMRKWQIEAEGDVVYVEAVDEEAARMTLKAIVGYVPDEIVTVEEIPALSVGEVFLTVPSTEELTEDVWKDLGRPEGPEGEDAAVDPVRNDTDADTAADEAAADFEAGVDPAEQED